MVDRIKLIRAKINQRHHIVADELKVVDAAEVAKGAGLKFQIKNINPKLLISTQNKNEISGSQVKRIAKDMKVNGFDTSQPIDVAVVNGKTIIIDGHHRAEAAIKAGIEKVPVRVNPITQE